MLSRDYILLFLFRDKGERRVDSSALDLNASITFKRSNCVNDISFSCYTIMSECTTSFQSTIQSPPSCNSYNTSTVRNHSLPCHLYLGEYLHSTVILGLAVPTSSFGLSACPSPPFLSFTVPSVSDHLCGDVCSASLVKSRVFDFPFAFLLR
jgi:hypothetical protein